MFNSLCSHSPDRKRQVTELRYGIESSISQLDTRTITVHAFRQINSLGSPIDSVIQKDGLNIVRLYFLNYTWHMNDLHNI